MGDVGEALTQLGAGDITQQSLVTKPRIETRVLDRVGPNRVHNQA